MSYAGNAPGAVVIPVGMVKGDGTSLSAATAGTDFAKGDTAQNWTASQRSGFITDNDASFNLSGAGNNYFCTPTAGAALTFTNIASNGGKSGYILFVNGSNYAITAAANTKVTSTFLATISATGTYLISYVCDATNVYVGTGGAQA